MSQQSQTGCIYIATVKEDKSYIGLTTNFPQRKREHLRGDRDTVFQNAIRKYGADAIEWRILEADIPIERLPDREELWIAFYDTYHNGYNMTEGGEVSPLKYDEVRQKVVESIHRRIAEGTHNFVTDNPSYQRVADGTHH